MTVKFSTIARLAVVTALMGAGTAANAAASFWNPTSVLSSGRWVRVIADDEGIHQITYDQLREWGFSNPANVRVYGTGAIIQNLNEYTNDIPDDLAPTQSMHTADGRLIFYSDGTERVQAGSEAGSASNPNTHFWNMIVRRNFYSPHSYYILSDSPQAQTTGCQTPAYAETDGLQPLVNHLSTQLHEEELQSVGQGGAAWQWYSVEPGQVVNMPYTIRDHVTDNTLGAAHFYIKMDAKYTSGTCKQPLTVTGPDDSFKVVSPSTNNGNMLVVAAGGLMSDMNFLPFVGELSIGPSADGAAVSDGEYTLSVTMPTNVSGLSYMAIDRSMLSYPRRNDMADQRQMVMQYPRGTRGQRVEVNGEVQVWNVSNPARVFACDVRVADGKTTLTLDRDYRAVNGAGECRLIAFDAAQTHPSVTFDKVIANQNLHSMPVPDMLVITTDELLPCAEELAQAHRDIDGMDVTVLTQSQIFNEFSAGVPATMGYRRVAKMFYDRSRTDGKFKYLMLYGAGSYDNRGITRKPDEMEYLLCYEAEPLGNQESSSRHLSANYCSDDYYGQLEDDFTFERLTYIPLSIPVGRIPATNTGDGFNINRKLIDYMTNPPSPANYVRMLGVSGYGDSNLHLKQNESSLTIARNDFPFTAVGAHCGIYPMNGNDNPEARTLIYNTLKQGTGYVTFTGHGSASTLGNGNVLTFNTISSNSYDTKPFAMLSTCLSYQFDRPVRAIGEQMFAEPKGGAIAVIGAARSVYASYNQQMENAAMRAFTQARPGATVGSVYKRAKELAIAAVGNGSSTSSAQRNNYCYNLCGDPAIKLPIPSRNAAITAINGVTDFTEDIVVTPYHAVTVAGQATDDKGNLDATFNGVAEIFIYDTPDILAVHAANEDEKLDVVVDHTLLASTKARVTDGLFEGSILLPMTTRMGNGDNCRVVVTLTDDADAGNVAIAGNRVLRLESTDAVLGNATAPVITEMYVNDPDFVNGATYPSSVTLHATVLLGEGGLNVSSAIGKGTKVIVDGKRNLTQAAFSMQIGHDGQATLTLPVNDLDDGLHTLTLCVSDNMENRVERSISFMVRNQDMSGTLTADVTTARTEVVLNLDHTYAAEPAATVIVRDKHGKTVFSKKGAEMPYTWNLLDNAGQRVTDGQYDISALLEDSSYKTSTPAITVTVIE